MHRGRSGHRERKDEESFQVAINRDLDDQANKPVHLLRIQVCLAALNSLLLLQTDRLLQGSHCSKSVLHRRKAEAAARAQPAPSTFDDEIDRFHCLIDEHRELPEAVDQ